MYIGSGSKCTRSSRTTSQAATYPRLGVCLIVLDELLLYGTVSGVFMISTYQN